MFGFLQLLLALLRAAVRDRGDLVAEKLLLRQQLEVLSRPTRLQPRLRTRDKLLWVLARAAWPDWRRHLVLVRPETVAGWRRRGWSLVWRRRSRGRPGRPRLDAETRALIARRARETPAWGSERSRGELLKLGIVVSKRSVQRYRRRGPARPPSQTWRTFVANPLGGLRAADPDTAAGADRSGPHRAEVRPPAAFTPAPARDRAPDDWGPGTARSDRVGTATTPPDPGQPEQARRITRTGEPRVAPAPAADARRGRRPHATARAPVAAAPGSIDRRRRAAARPGARGGRRVLHPRAPPSRAPAPGHRPSIRPATGPIRAQTGLAGQPDFYERAS